MSIPTVLIVDDNPENLSVLGEVLTPDYRVRVANSGARALELAAVAPEPSLILLDVMMPDMDGYETLRRLQAMPRGKDIPVIFVTSMDQVEDEERGLACGAVDYITKPFRPTIVLARAHAHIELKRARDQLRNQNAYLEAEVSRRIAEIERVEDVSVQALARLAETRDPETGNHILRTREYVRSLATRLQHHPRFASALDPRTIKLLAKSAPLHDIGKVGVPDHILMKPGALTPAEWTIMKTHARMGAEAIEAAERDIEGPAEFLAFAKEIAHRHHERWNGTGYPDGLAGDDIPLSARLMAVADVFDALISRRVYKAAMTFDEARAIIAGERGKHFDPDMTDAFVAGFDDFCAIARRYADVELADVELADVELADAEPAALAPAARSSA